MRGSTAKLLRSFIERKRDAVKVWRMLSDQDRFKVRIMRERDPRMYGKASLREYMDMIAGRKPIPDWYNHNI